VNDQKTHLATKHHMILCEQCQKPTTLTMEEHKKNECMMRTVECRHCHDSLLANAYLDHLTEHARDCKKRLILLKEMKSKEMILFFRYSKEIEDLFEFTYGTRIEESESL
jgi:hypothetical protein